MSANFAISNEKPVHVVFFTDLHHGADKCFSGKVNGKESVIKKAGSLALEFLPHLQSALKKMKVQPQAIYSLGDLITVSNGDSPQDAAALYRQAINAMHEYFPNIQKTSILGNNEWKGGIGDAGNILTGSAFKNTNIPFLDAYSSVELVGKRDKSKLKKNGVEGFEKITALNISCYCQKNQNGLHIIRDDELEHIAQALSEHGKKKTGLIITTHIPIQGHDRHRDNVEYSDKAHKILAQHQGKYGNIMAVLSGHVHQDHAFEKDNVPYISLAAPSVFVKNNAAHKATDIKQLSLKDLPLTFAVASLYPKSKAMQWNVYQGIDATPTTQIALVFKKIKTQAAG